MDQAVVVQLEPDGYLIEYYTMEDRRRNGLTDSSLLYYIKEDSLFNYANVQEAADNFRRRVVGWIRGLITWYGQRNVIITTAPRSIAGQLHDFLVTFCANSVCGIQNACYMPLLERTMNRIPSHEGGSRNQNEHEATITISIPAVPGLIIPPNTVILVLDDIWTTGCTLRACKNNLVGGIAGAEVKMLAIGRTQQLQSWTQF